MSPAPSPAQVLHPILFPAVSAVSVLGDLLAQEYFPWKRGSDMFVVPRNVQPGKLSTPLFPRMWPFLLSSFHLSGDSPLGSALGMSQGTVPVSLSPEQKTAEGTKQRHSKGKGTELLLQGPPPSVAPGQGPCTSKTPSHIQQRVNPPIPAAPRRGIRARHIRAVP